jgi:hypothetical protein
MPVLVELGIYRPQDVQDFYNAGREVIALIEARQFPFDGSYLDWIAPAEWTIPEAQPGWDRVPGFDLNITTGRHILVNPAAN